MARPTQTAEHIAEKRKRILDAALSVLESNGSIDSVTLRAVAKVLGWSYSAAYRYFSSKEDLLTALRTSAFRWMQDELSTAVKHDSSSIENLERLTHAYISAGMRRPDLYQLMFFNVDQREASVELKELEIAKRDCLNVCTEMMSRAQQSAEVDTHIDPLTAAHIFWVSAHGIVSLQIAQQFVMGRNTQEITHTMINLVLNGLQGLPETSQYFLQNTLTGEPAARPLA